MTPLLVEPLVGLKKMMGYQDEDTRPRQDNRYYRSALWPRVGF